MLKKLRDFINYHRLQRNRKKLIERLISFRNRSIIGVVGVAAWGPLNPAIDYSNDFEAFMRDFGPKVCAGGSGGSGSVTVTVPGGNIEVATITAEGIGGHGGIGEPHGKCEIGNGKNRKGKIIIHEYES